MRNLILWSFIGAMLLSCENRVPELDIVREEKVEKLPEEPVALSVDENWSKLPNGLFRAEFEVPPTFLLATGGGGGGDPFAASVTPTRTNSAESAKGILEGAGIIFGKGTSATYYAISSRLMVVQTEDQMELIEAWLQPLDGLGIQEKEIYVRAEIYELSTVQVLQLMESAQGEGDHSPERNAALNAVRIGRGKLIASTSIQCRSGQRAKVEGFEKMSFFLSSLDSNDQYKKDVIVGGTTMEVDAIYDAYQYTIDLNLQLIHYTGRKVKLADHSLLMHRKTITIQTFLHDGNYILIGNWKPTGDPRFEENDLSHVVFVTASIQLREEME